MSSDTSNKISKLREESRNNFLIFKHVINNPEELKDILLIMFNNSVKNLENMLHGMTESAFTGMHLGNKYGYSGGWIVGSFMQITSTIVSPIVGGFFGSILGLVHEKEDLSKLMNEYRKSFGNSNENNT